jgi:hypothetical protein
MGGDGPHHLVLKWDRVVPSFLPDGIPRWPLLITIFFSQKNDMVKSLGWFEVWKVPQTQRYTKQGSCSAELKQNKGNCLENPWNQWRTCPDPQYTIKYVGISSNKQQSSSIHFTCISGSPMSVCLFNYMLPTIDHEPWVLVNFFETKRSNRIWVCFWASLWSLLESTTLSRGHDML